MTNEKAGLHNEFVKFMLKKSETKDRPPQANQILSPAKKDPEVKPQDFTIKDEDVKQAEEQLKRIKNSIK